MGKVGDYFVCLADDVMHILNLTGGDKEGFYDAIWDSVLEYVTGYADYSVSSLELAQGYLEYNKDKKEGNKVTLSQRVLFRCTAPCSKGIPCMVLVSKKFTESEVDFTQLCVSYFDAHGKPMKCEWKEAVTW